MVPPFFASLAMSIAEHKSFHRFVHLATPRFDSNPDDRAYDFTSEVQGWLSNLALLERHGVACT